MQGSLLPLDEKVLSDAEIVQLMGYLAKRKTIYCKERLQHQIGIGLALFSGLRRAEIGALRWRDVLRGFDFVTWFVPTSAKRGSKMPALMSDFCAGLIRQLPRTGREVLSIGGAGVFMAWCRIQEELWGFRRYCLHDLRHTAITLVYRSCRDIELTRQFARHASYLTTQRYVHLVERERLVEICSLVERQYTKSIGFIGNYRGTSAEPKLASG